jgi:DNA/RNA-binding domain of Phe-tRNA-synthetase-like protein
MNSSTKKRFEVSSEIWNRYPGMKLVCVAGAGLDNVTHRTAVDDFFRSTQMAGFELMRGIELDNYAPFAEWRRVQPGLHFPAAHESLGIRVAGGKWLRAISPFVDCYNAISIDLLSRDIAAPIGAWCSDTLPTLRLGITKGGEVFTELGKSKAQNAEPGETAYFDGSGRDLVTRHFVWRQSQHGAIKPTTRSFFLISELIRPFATHTDTVLTELREACRSLFSVNVQSAVLDSGSDGWNWIDEV